MELTKIKFSNIKGYNVNKIISLIGNTLNINLDYEGYNTFYNGQFEKGTRLLFYKTLTEKELFTINVILRDNVEDYGCFYIDDEDVCGCGNELLFGKGCGVGLIYKNRLEIK